MGDDVEDAEVGPDNVSALLRTATALADDGLLWRIGLLLIAMVVVDPLRDSFGDALQGLCLRLRRIRCSSVLFLGVVRFSGFNSSRKVVADIILEFRTE